MKIVVVTLLLFFLWSCELDSSTGGSVTKGETEKTGGITQGNGISQLSVKLEGAVSIGIYSGDSAEFRIGELVQIQENGYMTRVFTHFPINNSVARILVSKGTVYVEFEKSLDLISEAGTVPCYAAYFELRGEEGEQPAYCVDRWLSTALALDYGIFGMDFINKNSVYISEGKETSVPYEAGITFRSGTLSRTGNLIWFETWGQIKSHQLAPEIQVFTSDLSSEELEYSYRAHQLGDSLLIGMDKENSQIVFEVFNLREKKIENFFEPAADSYHPAPIAAVGDYLFYTYGSQLYRFSIEEGVSIVPGVELYCDGSVYCSAVHYKEIAEYGFYALLRDRGNGEIIILYGDGAVKVLGEEQLGVVTFDAISKIGNSGFQIQGMSGLNQKTLTIFPYGDQNGNIVSDQAESPPTVRSLTPLL